MEYPMPLRDLNNHFIEIKKFTFSTFKKWLPSLQTVFNFLNPLEEISSNSSVANHFSIFDNLKRLCVQSIIIP